MMRLTVIMSLGCSACVGYREKLEKYYEDKDIELSFIDGASEEGKDFIEKYSVRGFPSSLLENEDRYLVLTGNYTPAYLELKLYGV